MSLNLDRTTLLQINVMNRVSESSKASLESIALQAANLVATKQTAKDATDAKSEQGGSIWNEVLNIVEAITTDESAAELDAPQLGAVLSAVVQNALTGEAVKTVKAYLSTGKKVLTAVKAGRNNIHQFRTKIEGEGEAAKVVEVGYEETRLILKSTEQKELDSAYKQIVGMLGKIRGRENDVRPASQRLADLDTIMQYLIPMTTKVAAAADAAKTSSKAAAAASELIQQQPSTAAVVEVAQAPEAVEVQTMLRTGTEG